MKNYLAEFLAPTSEVPKTEQKQGIVSFVSSPEVVSVEISGGPEQDFEKSTNTTPNELTKLTKPPPLNFPPGCDTDEDRERFSIEHENENEGVELVFDDPERQKAWDDWNDLEDEERK